MPQQQACCFGSLSERSDSFMEQHAHVPAGNPCAGTAMAASQIRNRAENCLETDISGLASNTIEQFLLFIGTPTSGLPVGFTENRRFDGESTNSGDRETVCVFWQPTRGGRVEARQEPSNAIPESPCPATS